MSTREAAASFDAVSSLSSTRLKRLVDENSEALDAMPDEVLLGIMRDMKPKTLRKFCSVSKRINSLCKDDTFPISADSKALHTMFLHWTIHSVSESNYSVVYASFHTDKRERPLYESEYFAVYMTMLVPTPERVGHVVMKVQDMVIRGSSTPLPVSEAIANGIGFWLDTDTLVYSYEGFVRYIKTLKGGDVKRIFHVPRDYLFPF